MRHLPGIVLLLLLSFNGLFGQVHNDPFFENFWKAGLENFSEELLPMEYLASPGKMKDTHHKSSLRTGILKQKLDSIIDYYWDINTDVITPDVKTVYFYDENDQQNRTDYYSWDKSNEKWAISVKAEIIYNENYQLKQFFRYRWMNETGWVNNYRIDYFYDDSSRVAEVVNYLWLETAGIWRGTNKLEYIYDDSGKLIINNIYSWNETASAWDPARKTEKTYNDEGKALEIISYVMDTATNQWRPRIKNNYTYATDRFEIYQSRWNIDSLQWDYFSKTENILDSDGYVAKVIINYYQEYTGEFYPSYKDELNRDANFNIYQQVGYTWNIDKNDWVRASLKNRLFDLNYGLNDLIIPKGYGYSNMLKEITLLRPGNTPNSWKYIAKTDYHYSEQAITGIDETVTTALKVYPNPTSDYIFFTFPSADGSRRSFLEIMDLHGRKVLSRMVGNMEPVSLNALKSGTYFYRLSIDEDKHYGKFIRE